MLTPVDEFKVPPDHFDKYSVIDRSVGTDPDLALRTRKGTGHYKVPSLRGVWSRGPGADAGRPWRADRVLENALTSRFQFSVIRSCRCISVFE